MNENIVLDEPIIHGHLHSLLFSTIGHTLRCIYDCMDCAMIQCFLMNDISFCQNINFNEDFLSVSEKDLYNFCGKDLYRRILQFSNRLRCITKAASLTRNDQ